VPARKLANPDVHGREAQRRRSREAILRAAARLFADRGYRGTSLDAVAEAAGLTKQGLLHHFPSKENLLDRVLAEREAQSQQVVTEAGTTSLTGLVELAAVNARDPENSRLFTVTVAEAVSAEHPAHEWARERYVRVHDRNRARIEVAIERGEIPPAADVEALARLLTAAMDGLQLQWLLDERVDMPGALGTLISLITSGSGRSGTG
jgi:AcrR family transcriptional regulator